MVGILILIVMLLSILAVVSRNENVEEKNKIEADIIFYKMATFIYKKILCLCKRLGKEDYFLFQSDKVRKDLQKLYPGDSILRREAWYYIHKIHLVLIIAVVGTFISGVLFIVTKADGRIVLESSILRNEYGEGSKEITLTPRSSALDSNKEMTIYVNEKKHSESEFQTIVEDMINKLPDQILNGNKSLEYVDRDLKLMTKMNPEYIQMKWESSDYSRVDEEGKIDLDNLEESGELILLTVTFSYFEYNTSHSFYVQIFPRKKVESEIQRENIELMVKQSEEGSQQMDSFSLPKLYNKVPVLWERKNDNLIGKLLLITVIGSIVAYFLIDKKLRDKVNIRNNELLDDYPEMISKLSLLVSAGLPIKTAWKKIVTDYKSSRNESYGSRYLYEEMLYTIHEMESGVAERKAYGNFGKRCHLQQYLKFSSLLTQNSKMGSLGIAALLCEEASEAWEMKKEKARILGEEAGTKLLFPMMLMMGVVMIIIMVPAFLTFRM